MEPFSLLAGAITQYVVPKVLNKIGDQVGEVALAKSKASIEAVHKAVQKKMKATNTNGVLAQAQVEPTEANIQVLETVLAGQIKADPMFAQQLQALLDEIEARSPKLQSVLENVRVKGSAEVGDVKQSSSSATQIVGRNLGVGGDLKIGNISQET